MFKILVNIIRVVFGFPLVCAIVVVPYCLFFLISGVDDANDIVKDVWQLYKKGF